MNTVSEAVKNEIEKRRTFAIISHPDAGKTTFDGETPLVWRSDRGGRHGQRQKEHASCGL